MIAIDTNVLVYAHRSATPEHDSAKHAIELAAASPDGWGITLTNLMEFWSVVTHPAASGRPSTPAEAARFIEALTTAGLADIWVPGPGFGKRLLRVAEAMKIKGARVFDLAISLAAFEAGAAEIWTYDSHFQSVQGLRVVHPSILK